MRFLLLSFLFLSFLNAYTISDNKLNQLSQNPTWLRLLHYDTNQQKTTILDDDFFLDIDGKTDPKKELLATIENYKLNDTQCKYPARYYWLSTQIKLDNYQIINPKCHKLSSWKLMKNTSSISIVFVSGYLGNPASAFGHSFIKINQKGKNKLFDTTISYGALLPPKYSMIEYIYSGIFGKYKSAYSDKYYYHQDMTYSNQEFRDMWEYRLNLTSYQQNLFLLHSWEIMGKKFRYYFFDKNCGYKVSEFLELIYDKPLIKSANLWYAPIETFYALDSNDITQIKYIPSKQKKMYAKYEILDNKEQKILNEIINNDFTQIPPKYKNIKKNSQAKILDFVIAYNQYKNTNGKKKVKLSKKAKIHKQKLLINRLQLPITHSKKISIKQKEPITTNDKPSSLGISLTNISNHNDSENYLSLHYTAFGIDRLGYNNLNGDELVAFDTKISLIDDKIKLDKMDIIRIKRIKTRQLPFENKNPFSWNLLICAQKSYFVNDKYDYLADFGAGLSKEIDNSKISMFVNLSAHSDKKHYRYRPNIDLYINLNKLKLSANLGIESEFDKQRFQKIYNLNLQYKYNKEISIFTNTKYLSSNDYYHSNQITEFGLKFFF